MSHDKTNFIPEWTTLVAQSILNTLKVSDLQVYEHSLRVGDYALKLSRDLGLSEYDQQVAYYTGLLHDVGKIGIHKTILHKPARLDPAEIELTKEHVNKSEEIILPLTQLSHFFKDVQNAVRSHHERMDGEGYPDKLTGDKIPLAARIVLVVDTFDSMSIDRPYRRGLPVDLVFAELKRCSGTQFDEDIVKTFIQAQPFWSESADVVFLENHEKKAA